MEVCLNIYLNHLDISMGLHIPHIKPVIQLRPPPISANFEDAPQFGANFEDASSSLIIDL